MLDGGENAKKCAIGEMFFALEFISFAIPYGLMMAFDACMGGEV